MISPCHHKSCLRSSTFRWGVPKVNGGYLIKLLKIFNPITKHHVFAIDAKFGINKLCKIILFQALVWSIFQNTLIKLLNQISSKTFKSNFKQLFENVCKQTAEMPTMAFWLVFDTSLFLNLQVHEQLFLKYLLPE